MSLHFPAQSPWRRATLSVALVTGDDLPRPSLAEMSVHVVRDPREIHSSDDVVLFHGVGMAQDLARFSAELADGLPPAAVLTRRLDWGDVCLAFKHGVTSYVLEVPHSCRLDEVLMCTAQRSGVLAPEIVERIRIEARGKGRTTTAKPGRSSSASEAIPGSRPLLSQRESQVMDLLASGLEVRDVARQLFLTDKTVRNYLSRIYSKVGVRNQAQAVLYWLGRADGPTPARPTRAGGRVDF